MKNLKNLNSKSQIKLQIREPNLLISYKRRYFMYKNIRITLDTKFKK